MATVTELFDGISLHFQLGVGTITREFLIEGLTASNNPNDLFAQAISISGIPSYASAHPNISGLYVSTFDAKLAVDTGGSVSRTAVRLTVTYSTPTYLPLGGVKVEISGSNSQTILNKWPGGPLKGQPILVGYHPDRTKALTAPLLNNAGQINPSVAVTATGSGNTGSTAIQGFAFDQVEIPIESPNLILTLTRTEFQFPRQGILYRRTLNSTAWLGFDPYTVLCRDVRAQNIIGAGVMAPSFYVTSYVFEIVDDPQRWQYLAVFRDEHTGKNVVCDVTSGTFNGYTIVLPYITKDFNGLKFPGNLLV